MKTRARRCWFVALCLLAGVVVNVLVTWGIGWYGVHLGRARVAYYSIGGRVVEARETRHRASHLVIWEMMSEDDVRVVQLFGKRFDGGGKLVVEVSGPLPELKLAPLHEAPPWASFLDPANHPAPVPANLMKLRPEADLAVGWPMESLSMRGFPQGGMSGGLLMGWAQIGVSIRAVPTTVCMPGFAVNSGVWAAVVGAGALTCRAAVRSIVRRKRERAALCGACGYDRRGLASGAACPECGAQGPGE